MKRELNFTGTSPILYIVATPIGNLDETNQRAINILKEMDYIACEDTRVTIKLLNRFKIKKTLFSCREFNEVASAMKIIEDLKKGLKIAYLTDAGYPAISDPGGRLIQKVLAEKIKVSVISGSSAFLNALVGSGLNTERFYFHGFLSPREKVRAEELRHLIQRPETLIFYEAPHRILKTLQTMLQVLGNRRACLARELTKKHEEYIRMNLSELVELEKETLKGEMVIVIEGFNSESPMRFSDEDINKLVYSIIRTGVSPKDAIKKVSEQLNISKNYVYKVYTNFLT